MGIIVLSSFQALKKITADIDQILATTCLHFSFMNRLTSDKMSIPKAIENLIDLGIEFWVILAPFGRPC